MTYRVDLTERAARNLRRIYQDINAESAVQARDWFNGLEKAILGLEQYPARGTPIPEGGDLRHLLYGRKGHRYRIIYAIDDLTHVVTVLHIRHGSQAALTPDDPQ